MTPIAIVFFFFRCVCGGGFGVFPPLHRQKNIFFYLFFWGKMVLFCESVNKKDATTTIVKRDSTKLENLNYNTSINLWKKLLGKLIVTSHSHVININSIVIKKRWIEKKKLKKIINFLVFFFFSLLHYDFLFLISYVYLMNFLVKVGSFGRKKVFFFAKILRYKKKQFPIGEKQFSCKRCFWGTLLYLDKL